MWIQDVFQNIFLRIADHLGLRLEVKPPLVGLDYKKVNEISITATIANRIATLTTCDSNIVIKGKNLRADYLRAIVDDVIKDKFTTMCEVALGTGDCLIKPYTDGSRIGVDLIENGDFYVCESIGNFIKSCIIRCEVLRKTNGDVFERFETQRLSEVQTTDGGVTSAVFIYQKAYRNGTEVTLDSVPEWSGIQEFTVIPYATSLLFGRIKCPTVNREHINSVNGVPITYGMDDVMQKVVDSYNQMNEEFVRKEAYVFADKSLFSKSAEGKPELPTGKRRLFMTFAQTYNTGEPQSLLHEYSPDIRDESYSHGIEMNEKMLELICGLSSGILTSPTTNFATATEMRNALQLTYAYMTRLRANVDVGVRQLVNSIDIIASSIGITLVGDYSVMIDWSSQYIEFMDNQFERLVKLYELGLAGGEEVRSWVQDESLDDAKQKILAIEAAKAANNAVSGSETGNNQEQTVSAAI